MFVSLGRNNMHTATQVGVSQLQFSHALKLESWKCCLLCFLGIQASYFANLFGMVGKKKHHSSSASRDSHSLCAHIQHATKDWKSMYLLHGERGSHNFELLHMFLSASIASIFIYGHENLVVVDPRTHLGKIHISGLGNVYSNQVFMIREHINTSYCTFIQINSKEGVRIRTG